MKPLYRYLAAVAAFGLLAMPRQSSAQDFTECPDDVAECIVEWADGSGLPIINALRNTIVNDDDGGGVNIRPADRVYVLRRGGLYYDEDRINNDGWDLRLYGQTAAEARPEDNVCGTNFDEDCGPAVIQKYSREDGSIDGVMIQSDSEGGGQYLTNLWLQGMSNTGQTAFYEPMVINSSNSTFVYDNVIFDRNDWHHLGFKSGGNSITIKNSTFRNLVGPTQRWEGRGIRLEAGAAELLMENNTFFNITSFPVQSEAEPIEYFVFNHNTVVNNGMAFNAGAIWKTALIANNILMNPFWQGEDASMYNQVDRIDPYTGVFTIATLPARFGLETDRRILLANNAWYRADDFTNYYATFDPVVRGQPLVSDTTMQWFNLYSGMVIDGNLNQDPGFTNGPFDAATYDSMKTFIEGVSVDMDGSYPIVMWDPGRDPNPLAINFPRPEDFTYSNEALKTAGTDGLPLGDLNWYPDAKDTYLANRDTYLQALLDMTGGEPEAPLANPGYQGEAGTVDGGNVVAVEGFTDFYMESSGSITWNFDIPTAGIYDMHILTHLRGNNVRGQNFTLDDSLKLRNYGGYGEIMVCTADWGECVKPLVSADSFLTAIVLNDELSEGSLDLAAGSHKLVIAPSWGYQSFSNIDFVDPTSGDTVATLTPPDAVSLGVTEECGDENVFCASGFKYAALDAGGTVEWSVELPATTMSVLPQVFYTGGGAAEVWVDGAKAADVSFPLVDGTSAGNVLAPRVNVSEGTHTITLKSLDGGLNVDYAIMNAYLNPTTGVDEQTLPDGWALDQNYPNPFNGNTYIPVTIGDAGDVNLTVYDLMGRKVAVLMDGRMPSGTYNVPFSAKTATTSLASGVYFYRLQTPVGQQVRQMILVK